MSNRRDSMLRGVAVDIAAAAWLARGGWRMTRGRLPWSSRRRHGVGRRRR